MARPQYHVGDRVEDVDSKRPGTVVHVYEDPEIKDELVAVRWDDNPTPLCVHVDDIKVRS